jgi:integrase
VRQLVASARGSSTTIQGYDGEQRARIYLISYLTGLRRKEIASLTPRSFELDANPPSVVIEAACSKHRKTDVLPLHADLVKLLRAWIRGVPADQVLSPRLTKRKTWRMVRKDLERVGIPYETAEGIADFHAAGRHSHITGLLNEGVPLHVVQRQARHGDIRMTMRYTHVDMDDRAKAVARLPGQCLDTVSHCPNSPLESQAGTTGKPKRRDKKDKNPCGDRGYDATGRVESSAVADDQKWRRRELNPRPAICP